VLGTRERPRPDAAVDREVLIDGAVDVHDRHRLGRGTVVDAERAGHDTDPDDAIRQLAGQPVAHDAAVGAFSAESVPECGTQPAEKLRLRSTAGIWAT
jgi:hypothetical protein